MLTTLRQEKILCVKPYGDSKVQNSLWSKQLSIRQNGPAIRPRLCKPFLRKIEHTGNASSYESFRSKVEYENRQPCLYD